MPLRLFRCRDCGHQMRLGARHCGSCLAHAPSINVATQGFIMFLFAVLGVSVLAVILSR